MHLLTDYYGIPSVVGTELSVRPTGKVRFFTRQDKVVACAELFDSGSQTLLYLCVSTPLAPIQKMLGVKPVVTKTQMERLPAMEKKKELERATAQLEGDWLDSILEKGKGIAVNKLTKKMVNTIKHPAFQQAAKAVGRSAFKAVKNPTVQKFAMYSATSIAASFGVPPQATMAAAGVLTKAMAGDPMSKAKVANIDAMAAQGNPSAQALKGAMGKLYLDGLSLMKPYLQEAVKAGAGRNPALATKWLGYAEQALPLAQKAGLIPFTLPGDTGVSGWLYNVPYRSPIQARLQRMPQDLLRSPYHKGLGVRVAKTKVGEFEGWEPAWYPDEEVGARGRPWPNYTVSVMKHNRRWPYRGTWRKPIVDVESHWRRKPSI